MHENLARTSAPLAFAAARIRGLRPPFALCYHGVGPPGRDGDPHGLMLPEERFAQHLDVLHRLGSRLIGAQVLADTIERDGVPGATGLGALTFDDGLAESMAAVARLVDGRDVTVTAFVPSGLLGRPHPHLAGGHRIVDRRQLLELADGGMEIGAHSVDHADLRTLPAAQALDQLRRSRATLEDILGQAVTGMAYPFGSFGAETIRLAREAGYRSAWACSGPGPWRALALPREPVFPTTGARRLRVKVAGLYGPVHAMQRWRSRARGGQLGRDPGAASGAAAI